MGLYTDVLHACTLHTQTCLATTLCRPCSVHATLQSGCECYSTWLLTWPPLPATGTLHMRCKQWSTVCLLDQWYRVARGCLTACPLCLTVPLLCVDSRRRLRSFVMASAGKLCTPSTTTMALMSSRGTAFPPLPFPLSPLPSPKPTPHSPLLWQTPTPCSFPGFSVDSLRMSVALSQPLAGTTACA